MDRFNSKERLRECHHMMSSQKNEAMNRVACLDDMSLEGDISDDVSDSE
jgi:hypothetical protein